MIIESTAGLVIGAISIIALCFFLYQYGKTNGREESRFFIRALESELRRARPYIGQPGTSFTRATSNPTARRIYPARG